jgi:hypothetical protein
MPIRLCLVLAAACLLPAVGECAAPFVAWSHGPSAAEMLEASKKAVTSAGPEVDLGLMQPLGWEASNISKIVKEQAKRVWPYESYGGGMARVLEQRERDMLYTLKIVDAPSIRSWLDQSRAFESVDAWRRWKSGFPEKISTVLERPEIPTLRLGSRCLMLHLDIAGIDRWDRAVVEVWITRDGWTWRPYHREAHCETLRIHLPEEGRYGIRLVVEQDSDELVSQESCLGDSPQLWLEIDESLPVLGTPKRRVANGNICLYHEGEDLRGEAKPAKRGGIGNPRAEIVRVDAEMIVLPPPPCPFMFGGYMP